MQHKFAFSVQAVRPSRPTDETLAGFKNYSDALNYAEFAAASNPTINFYLWDEDKEVVMKTIYGKEAA